LWLFGSTFGRVAFFVLTPALYLLAVQLSGVVGFLTAPLCLLALALTVPVCNGSSWSGLVEPQPLRT
jgi:hypothetical protein